jgi:hypothetical protein
VLVIVIEQMRYLQISAASRDRLPLQGRCMIVTLPRLRALMRSLLIAVSIAGFRWYEAVRTQPDEVL